jgi:hypothetical protein
MVAAYSTKIALSVTSGGNKMIFRKSLFSLLIGGGLVACGGGGSSTPPPATTPEGPYSGTITGSATSAAFSAVVLEDGQVWTLYGNNVGGGLVVSGLIQGQGTSSNGSFTSTSVKDFGYSPALSATLTATYVAGVSLNGTFSAGGTSANFAGTVIPSATFNYNTPALLSNVVGNWSLSSTSGSSITLTVAANGSFTGTATGACTLSGQMAPRASGKNIYDVQLLIGPAPCALPGWSGAGIGLYTTLTNGTHQLIIAMVDSTRSVGTASFGTR